MPQLRLVTQAYGTAEIRLEALYAAWSALAYADGVPLGIHVYTDVPEDFAPLAGRISTEHVTPERIRAWRGPYDFIHRLKPEMLRDMVRRFPEDKLLYVDADVYFVAPVSGLLDRIGPGRSVMHEREYSVATHDSDQMKKFRRNLSPLSFRGSPIDLSRDMWNAGAIGVDPAHFHHFEEWLEFIDAIYPHYRRGLVEQYGICRLLQRETKIAPADDVIFHYWFQKDDYVAVIRRELETLASLPFEASLAHLRANTIRIPRRRVPTTFKSRMQRIWTKIRPPRAT